MTPSSRCAIMHSHEGSPMPTDERPSGRGPMRSWLKSILESGVLETMRASEATGGDEPELFARDLLARLREADGGMRPDDPLAIAFREFRRWVEVERRAMRLRLLGDPPRRVRLRGAGPDESPTPRKDAKVTAAGKASAGRRLDLVGRSRRSRARKRRRLTKRSPSRAIVVGPHGRRRSEVTNAGSVPATQEERSRSDEQTASQDHAAMHRRSQGAGW